MDYSPWFSGGTDLTTGFEGDFGTLKVGTGGAQTSGLINEAIGDQVVHSVTGGTINFYSGTYNEDVAVYEAGLTLRKAGGGTVTVRAMARMPRSPSAPRATRSRV